MSPSSVAAIVPQYSESSEAINRTLRAILEQSVPPDHVVLVDDGSPAVPDVDAAIRNRIEVMVLGQNVGVSQARNQGASVTNADYLMFTNCDVELAADWVERAVAFMDANPRAGVISGRIIPEVGSQLLRDWRLQHIETKVHRTDLVDPLRVQWVVGHVMFVRRTAFDDIEGFDPGYRRAGDDADFCQRLAAAGWDNYHLPTLSATSHEPATVGALARKCVRNSGWNLRRQCAPCKAIKPLRPARASVSTVRLFAEHAARDLLRRRFRFVGVDVAIAARSLALIWAGAIFG